VWGNGGRFIKRCGKYIELSIIMIYYLEYNYNNKGKIIENLYNRK
jgi:hypothetical protein